MKKILSTFLILTLCVSCAPKKQAKENVKLGQYVYLDSEGILHVRRPCLGLRTRIDGSGEGGYKSIQFIEVDNITHRDLESLCPWCVSDEVYEQLIRLVDTNY